MKRYGMRLTLLGMILLLQTGCGTVDKRETVESQVSSIEITESESEEAAESSEQQEIVTETSDEKQETTQIENTPEPTNEPEVLKESLVVDRIPVKHSSPIYVGSGTIQEISYPTKDYYGDGSELTKPAYVYLPKDYDETKQYNVLYLMHGVGGNEREWGMTGNGSQVK